MTRKRMLELLILALRLKPVSLTAWENVQLRAINLLTGDHWKNFLRHLFDPLQTYNTE